MLRDTVKYFNGMGLFDTFLSGYFGDKQIKAQNKANMQLAQYQTQVQEEMYNKYSSPEALMRQYREAGLNPNLVYGSASAGQHNVPSYQAPTVERYLSGRQKVDAALSAISAALNIKQGIYQVDAAREGAEQSAIRTLSDMLDLSGKNADYLERNYLSGGLNGLYQYARRFKDPRRSDQVAFLNPSWDLYFNKHPDTARYMKASRENFFNKQAQPMFNNVADFGLRYDHNGQLSIDQYFGTPLAKSRNAQGWLNYKLKEEIGNTGTYGKLLISLLGLL